MLADCLNPDFPYKDAHFGSRSYALNRVSGKAGQDQPDPDGVVVAVITRPIMQCSNGDACGAVALSGPGTNLQPSFMIAKDVERGDPAEILQPYRVLNSVLTWPVDFQTAPGGGKPARYSRRQTIAGFARAILTASIRGAQASPATPVATGTSRMSLHRRLPAPRYAKVHQQCPRTSRISCPWCRI